MHSGISFSLKNQEILTFATTWIKLGGIMLCEISRIWKAKYCMYGFLFYVGLRKVKSQT